MYIAFTIFIVIAAVLLTLLVLIQNSKGGGLASGFASGNQVMGAPKTADFLEKASWSLAGFIVVLSILAVGISKGTSSHTEDANAAMMERIQTEKEAQQNRSVAPAFQEATTEEASVAE